LEACRDTLTTTSSPTPSKSQKTTPAQNCDDECGEQSCDNSSSTLFDSQKTTPVQNSDGKRGDQHSSKVKISYQAEVRSTEFSCKILLPISLIGNFLSFTCLGECII